MVTMCDVTRVCSLYCWVFELSSAIVFITNKGDNPVFAPSIHVCPQRLKMTKIRRFHVRRVCF